MCLFRSRTPPPPPPVPAPPPPPLKKVKKIENPAVQRRMANRRRGGMRALRINRTQPNIGARGAGARAV